MEDCSKKKTNQTNLCSSVKYAVLVLNKITLKRVTLLERIEVFREYSSTLFKCEYFHDSATSKTVFKRHFTMKHQYDLDMSQDIRKHHLLTLNQHFFVDHNFEIHMYKSTNLFLFLL